MAKATKKPKETKRKTEVEISGHYWNAAVAIEGDPIDLKKVGSGSLKGDKTVTLDEPYITMVAVIKGGPLAAYDIAVTINKKKQNVKGNMPANTKKVSTCEGGVKRDCEKGVCVIRRDWKFTSFDLGKKPS